MELYSAIILAFSVSSVVCNGVEYEPISRFTLGTGEDYVKGSIWPKPLSENRNDEVLFSLNPKQFSFQVLGKDSDVLDAALVRYKSLIFPDNDVDADYSTEAIVALGVDVVEDMHPQTLESDESYTLVVSSPKSLLTAKTIWGALRGLETFSQVVYQNETGAYFAAQNEISDSPRFKHRGFMIDSSRHYLAVPIILQFLDAMSYSKFNVLHWHIVDDQSFPYVSKEFPSLYQTGAWNNKTHIYTAKDIQTILEYARMRGIRVMPEFDTPGHTQSWFSIPNLLTKCYSGGKPNGNNGPIDPTIPSNYAFLQKFFGEVAGVFPDEYIHLGGDEVSFSCWESNPNVLEWMDKQGYGKNFSKLEEYYEQKLLNIISGLGKRYIIWQEVVDNQVKVKPNTVVNIWKGGWQNEMKKVTSLGLQVILSSPWYLNYISYGPDWPTYYKVDPQDFNGTNEEISLVVGGTACMWGEWVDGTNIIARTWGRGLSVGERLWSPRDTTDITDATARIWEHRCRYLRRGIQAENVVQSKYCRHEWRNPK